MFSYVPQLPAVVKIAKKAKKINKTFNHIGKKFTIK